VDKADKFLIGPIFTQIGKREFSHYPKIPRRLSHQFDP